MSKQIKKVIWGRRTIWIEKRGDEYIVYRTATESVYGIASPSIMSMYGHEELKQAFECGFLKEE